MRAGLLTRLKLAWYAFQLKDFRGYVGGWFETGDSIPPLRSDGGNWRNFELCKNHGDRIATTCVAAMHAQMSFSSGLHKGLWNEGCEDLCNECAAKRLTGKRGH